MVLLGVSTLFCLVVLWTAWGPLAAAWNTADWVEWVVAVFLAVILWRALKKTLLPSWPFGWLYVYRKMGIRLTADEAKRVAFSLDGSVGEWYGPPNLKLFPSEHRKDRYLREVNDFARRHKRPVPFPLVEAEWESFRQREQQEERRREAEAAQQRARQAQEAEAKRARQRQQSESRGQQQRSSQDDSQAGVPIDVIAAFRIFGFHDAGATPEQVREVWRRRMQGLHPDRYAKADAELREFAELRTVEVNHAYQRLQRWWEKRT